MKTLVAALLLAVTASAAPAASTSASAVTPDSPPDENGVYPFVYLDGPNGISFIDLATNASALQHSIDDAMPASSSSKRQAVQTISYFACNGGSSFLTNICTGTCTYRSQNYYNTGVTTCQDNPGTQCLLFSTNNDAANSYACNRACSDRNAACTQIRNQPVQGSPNVFFKTIDVPGTQSMEFP